MSASPDESTIKQNASYIKSQRQERIVTNKLQEEDEEDQNTIFSALKRMRERGITDTNQFTWQLVHNENVNENKNEYDEKQNNKQNNNKQKKLSQLIDVNNNEMCKYGHGKIWE
eukprot:448275_1